MTAKQRAGIYRKAAEELLNRPEFTDIGALMNLTYRGCCSAIHRVGGAPDVSSVTEKDFPELFLFDNSNYRCYWWPDSAASIQPRILALLLCEQMALNP